MARPRRNCGTSARRVAKTQTRCDLRQRRAAPEPVGGSRLPCGSLRRSRHPRWRCPSLRESRRRAAVSATCPFLPRRGAGPVRRARHLGHANAGPRSVAACRRVADGRSGGSRTGRDRRRRSTPRTGRRRCSPERERAESARRAPPRPRRLGRSGREPEVHRRRQQGRRTTPRGGSGRPQGCARSPAPWRDRLRW